MYLEKKISEDIYYVGVNDRQTTLFEGLWELPAGVSYNSYLIKDDKTCLIDTVDALFAEQFMRVVFVCSVIAILVSRLSVTPRHSRCSKDISV